MDVIPTDQPPWARSRDAKLAFGVSGKTLVKWARTGAIRSFILPGSGERMHRLYDLTSVSGQPTVETAAITPDDHTGQEDVIYARVSTRKQQPYLETQITALRATHPHVQRVFSDVCSGINFQRRGLSALLDLAFAGRVRTVYVAHRDRLCRFAFDLIVDILRRCGATVSVDAHDPRTSTPEGELADDILSIITVFGARLYGARSGRRRVAPPEAETPGRKRRRAAVTRRRGPGHPETQGPDGQEGDAELPGADAADCSPTQGVEALV
jgi:predicted site-specific integrase-resolvase